MHSKQSSKNIDYNSAQQKVIDLLGASSQERPKFDTGLGSWLRSKLEDVLAPQASTIDNLVNSGAITSRSVRMSKHRLGKVLGCERNFVVEEEEHFAWSPPLARGTVSHKAIELAVNWQSEPHPLDLVDVSIERLADSDHTLGEYLRSCSDVELAELRAEANQRTAKFLECFPPLKAAWTPVTELSLRATLLENRVVLSGRPDLALGRSQGDVAGKVIIDFKSGGYSPGHREDLRFYALLETLRMGLPPRMMATYYLDSGDLHPESVTDGVLEAAADRVIDGTRRYLEIIADLREPGTMPGPACFWCRVRSDCVEGSAYFRATGAV